MAELTPEDFESRVPLLMGVLIGLGTASTLAVALRFVARGAISRVLGFDDWMILVASVCSILVSITGSIAASYGMGKHIIVLSKSQIMNGIMFVWYARVFTLISFGFLKLSIALLFLRIFSVSQSFARFIYCTIGFNGIISIIWLVMTIQCIPVSVNWDREQLPTARCIKDNVTVSYAFFAGVSHSILDVTYVVLPLVFVWKLQLPLRAKFGLTLLLSFGLFAAVCSMIKISKTNQLGKTTDITWEFTELSIWNVTELNVGIIVASIPPMRPLLSLVYHNTSDVIGISSLSRSRQAQTNGTAVQSKLRTLVHKDSGEFELVDRPHGTGGNNYGIKQGDFKGSSEESILEPRAKGIVQTREYQVSSIYTADK